MLAEEQSATVHADVCRALPWNRAEKMFGAFSIEEMQQGNSQRPRTTCEWRRPP